MSDHVGMTEHMLFTAGWKLLRPVDDGRFEEATTAQLEEGDQIPHHAQTTARQTQTRNTVKKDTSPLAVNND